MGDAESSSPSAEIMVVCAFSIDKGGMAQDTDPFDCAPNS